MMIAQFYMLQKVDLRAFVEGLTHLEVCLLSPCFVFIDFRTAVTVVIVVAVRNNSGEVMAVTVVIVVAVTK
jgi:hypothetical protein